MELRETAVGGGVGVCPVADTAAERRRAMDRNRIGGGAIGAVTFIGLSLDQDHTRDFLPDLCADFRMRAGRWLLLWFPQEDSVQMQDDIDQRNAVDSRLRPISNVNPHYVLISD